MGFKTFNAGDVLTASDVNTYLMKQAVIVCTSATRPSSPVEGMTIYETDTDGLRIYDGATWQLAVSEAAWTGYNPTWTGSSTNPVIGNGQLSGEYLQIGKTVIDTGIMVAGSTTTFGTGNFQLGFPVTPTSRANTTGGVIGACFINDNSAGAVYVSRISSTSTTISLLISSPTTVTANVTTPTIPMTWAVSDRFSWLRIYQAA